MFVGYLILAALGIAFLALGTKAFTSNGLPLTRRKNLTGPIAKGVGVACIVVGLGILVAGAYDYVVTFGPRPNPPVNSVKTEKEREINDYGPPEYAHNMSGADASMGFISLFDGKTTYGWSDGKVEHNMLVSGTSIAHFHEWLNLDIARGGKLIVSGEERAINKGGWVLPGPQSAGAIKLDGGIAVQKMWARPKVKSLLNLQASSGTDVAGWKPINDRADPNRIQPKWEIRNNILHVSGARGAIEYTVSPFGDFVFQTEVRTKAHHAKGAFLVRCQPGSMETGYEFPIYNSCENKDASRPTESCTGSIAGHQNARRLVSRDGEFFTITILAHGSRFATWVNGSQQSAWIDTRPQNENARKGLRLEPGTIQLLINDPESEFEFRNIQGRELADKTF